MTSMVCDGHAGRFYNAYNRYCESSKHLFNNPRVKTNHHYALHIPEQLKLWGPMMGVAEFAGERTIGLLQRVTTNRKISELHGTLMRKCQEKQKLIARHANVWEEGEEKRKGEGRRMGNLIEVEEAVFEGMLGMLRSQGISVRDYQRLPHPIGGWVLNNQALTVRGLVFNDKKQRVSVMPPNNVIYYKQNRKMMYGWIKSIYLFPRIGAPPTPGILINPIINHYPLPGY
ncbi:hypothetical protein O181_096629 [Austropuccinia psidii MF-1]|uniref:Uncharacterized protein n=1 Tax=Austropuccinia psidii MF-1 TaxID=1389203 RepID=A0A9Q3J7N4_9BASI|nr:hypothetical protein [Austropuccinia psidii MF-1]